MIDRSRILARAALFAVALVAAVGPGRADEAKAWIGVVVERSDREGTRILAVVPGGPADRAGLRTGDVLLELGGNVLTTGADVSEWLRRLAPGDEFPFVVRRGDQEIRGTLRAATRDDRRLAPGAGAEEFASAPQTGGAVDVGLFTLAIPPDLRRHLGAPSDEGVLLSSVVPGSMAEAAGLRIGDVLVRASGLAVRSPGDLYRALLTIPPDGTVALEVVRDGRTEILTFPVDRERDRSAAEAAQERARILRLRIEALRRTLDALERELAQATERSR